MNEFMQAVASYLGLGEGASRKAEVFTDAGTMCVAFEVALSPDDLVAICDRMKARREAAPTPQAQVEPELPSYEELVRDPSLYRGMIMADDSPVLMRVKEIEGFGADFDVSPGSVRMAYRSRFNYMLYRARERDLIDVGVTSNADDFGGMPG